MNKYTGYVCAEGEPEVGEMPSREDHLIIRRDFHSTS